MKKALGLMAGLFILALAARALQTAMLGWSGGHADVGFWWSVITGFLAVAGFGALIGTVVHTRRPE